MEKFRFDCLASNLLLDRELKFLVGVKYENGIEQIEYRIKPIQPKSSGLSEYILNKTCEDLPQFNDIEKLRKNLEDFEVMYKENNPLTLITIKNIPYNFKLDKDSKEIPDFFYKKMEELILSLSFIYSASIKPLIFYLSSNETDVKLLNLSAGGITVDKYKKIYKERDFNSLVNSYLWKIVMLQRYIPNEGQANEKALTLKLALNFYRSALATTSVGREQLGVGIKFILFWTALEVLANSFRRFEKERKPVFIQRMINTLLPNEKHSIEMWWKMRNYVVHSGRPKNSSYSQENGKIRELIEKLIFKIVEKENI